TKISAFLLQIFHEPAKLPITMIISGKTPASRPDGLPPRVQRVVEELTQRINQGRLRPGDQLPTLRDLGRALGVSYGVMHAAFRHLEGHGLIETIQGSGTYVRQRGEAKISRNRGTEVYILVHSSRHPLTAALDTMVCAIQDRGLMPIMLAFDRFEP